MTLRCDRCGRFASVEEMNLDTDTCSDCDEKWFQEQLAYWKPLWRGETSNGFYRLENGELVENENV